MALRGQLNKIEQNKWISKKNFDAKSKIRPNVQSFISPSPSIPIIFRKTDKKKWIVPEKDFRIGHV